MDCVRTRLRYGADVLIEWRGLWLDDIADRTSIADALKAALRVPSEKRRRLRFLSHMNYMFLFAISLYIVMQTPRD
jgi:hypothetical protein